MRYFSISPSEETTLYNGKSPEALSDEELRTEFERLKKRQLNAKDVPTSNMRNIRVLQRELARRS